MCIVSVSRWEVHVHSWLLRLMQNKRAFCKGAQMYTSQKEMSGSLGRQQRQEVASYRTINRNAKGPEITTAPWMKSTSSVQAAIKSQANFVQLWIPHPKPTPDQLETMALKESIFKKKKKKKCRRNSALGGTKSWMRFRGLWLLLCFCGFIFQKGGSFCCWWLKQKFH